jgi:hypothetical protein
MMFHGRTVLLVVGLGFAVAPVVGGLRRLPAWIRFALTMSGVSLFLGAVIGFALERLRVHFLARLSSLFTRTNWSFMGSASELFCC